MGVLKNFKWNMFKKEHKLFTCSFEIVCYGNQIKFFDYLGQKLVIADHWSCLTKWLPVMFDQMVTFWKRNLVNVPEFERDDPGNDEIEP